MPNGTPSLILTDAPGQPAYPLAEGTTRLGRASVNDISLKHRSISRLHCELVRQGDTLRIQPVEGANPTYVGSERACGQVLRDGDVIRVGARQLTYRAWAIVAAAAAAAAAPPVAEEVAEHVELTAETPPPVRRRPVIGPPAVPVTTTPPAPISTAPVAPRPRRRRRSLRPVVGLCLSLLSTAALTTTVLMSEGWRAADPAPVHAALVDPARHALQQRLAEADRQLAAKEAELSALLDEANRRSATRARQETEHRTKRTEAEAEAARAARAQAQAHRRQLAATQEALDRLTRDRDRLAAERDRLATQQTPATPPQARVVAPQASARPGRSLPMAGTARAEEASRPSLTDRDVDGLVKALKEALENYASPFARPADLEPHLTRLTSSSNKRSAVGAVRVYDHARRLLTDLDRLAGVLERRREAYQRGADVAAKNNPAQGSGTRRQRGQVPTGAQLAAEQRQRSLELIAKKVQIKGAQRKRLVAMRDHLTAGFARLTAEAQTRYLAGKLRDRDPVQRTAILAAIKNARARHAVPQLIDLLDTKDAALRDAAHATLRAVSGVDHGTRQTDWRAWWKDNKGV